MDEADASPDGEAAGDDGAHPGPAVTPDPGWTWPPAGLTALVGTADFATEQWAPPSTVRHPLLRVGRWTLLYRRAAPRRPLAAHLGGRLHRLPLHLSLRLPHHLHGRASRRATRRR